MSTSKIHIAGSGEKIQYLAHDFNDNTIRFILHYPGIVDADILCAAAKELVGCVDILHASFFTDKIGAYWHVNKEYEESSFFQFVETEGDPAVTAYSLALLPIAPESKVQLRCLLVQGKTAGSVVFNVSHLCVDGGDGKYLLQKLSEAYCMIKNTGSAKGLAVKNGSRAAEQVYENINTKEMLSLLKNPFSSVKTVFPYPDNDPGRLRMVNATIPAAVMGNARRRAKAGGATANDLLLASCYHAYAALPAIDKTMPMSIMSMMDLRRHCKNGESEGLCNMSGSLPTTLPNGIQGDLADTIAQIAVQTNAAKNNPLAGLEGLPIVHGASRTIPIGILLLVSGKIYGSMSIGMTNLGNISCGSLSLGDLAPISGAFGGPLKKKPSMQISAVSFDGTCSLSVVGKYTETDAVLLQAMLDHMVKDITKYAEDQTLGNRTS